MRINQGLVLVAMRAVAAIAQTQQATHVVSVNPDGTFRPQVVRIRSGDTVRWERLTRTDSIVAVTGPADYPALCSSRAPYQPDDPNEFTGPQPFAPSGIFTLGSFGAGFSEATGRSCPDGSQPVARGDGQSAGKILCSGTGEYQATMESTWRNEAVTGVFIRLLWKDFNPQREVYDFAVVEREMNQAVKYGKLFSVSIKAGDDGTPDWIFSTDAGDAPRPDGAGLVPRLHFQDLGSDSRESCGARLDLGNPARAEYQDLYFAALRALADFIRSRADWYRSLAYVKTAGANLFSEENRLPKRCDIIERGGQKIPCVCNSKILSEDGFRPSGLYAFYDAQTALLRELFPGKPMSYALIQDGFPRISESGGWETPDGVSSDGSALPGAFELTQTLLDRNQRRWGVNWVVQHNGVGPKISGCNFDGRHPKPLVPLDGYWDVASGCPNRWAVREGAQGQITGYQSKNLTDVNTPAQLDTTLQNFFDNTDGVFFEIYEPLLWLVSNTSNGILPGSRRTLAAWAGVMHARRTDKSYSWLDEAPDPFPATYSRRFRRTAAGDAPQILTYIHGMKCGNGAGEWGQIIIDDRP